MELNINVKVNFNKKKKRLSSKKPFQKMTIGDCIQIVNLLITILTKVINSTS